MADHDVIIIGAGIAGAAMAHELRARGRNVTVIESASAIASGASGNPKGIIKPFLSLGDDRMRQLYHAAYAYGLETLGKLSVPILQRGVVQFPSETEIRYPTAPALAGLGPGDLIYLSAAETSELLQTESKSETLFWPSAVVVNPLEWVRALLGDTPTKLNMHITKVHHDKNWICTTDKHKTFSAKQIIVASGHASDLLAPFAPDIVDQLRPRMGQITMLPAAALPALPRAISFARYLISSSAADDPHILGATFAHTDQIVVTRAGHESNILALQNFARILPALSEPAARIVPETCQGRSAVRPTTLNHLPIWGEAAPGLFYLTGLGSRGLMSAPYVAQQLCRIICSV